MAARPSGERPNCTSANDVGERAVVGLGPAVERVLVALGAFDPDAQERRGRALGQRLDRDVLPVDEPPPEQVEARLGGVVVGGPVLAARSSARLRGATQASASPPSRLVAQRTPRAISVVRDVRRRTACGTSRATSAPGGGAGRPGPSIASTSQPVMSR